MVIKVFYRESILMDKRKIDSTRVKSRDFKQNENIL
jgi:hypothetical protein